MPRSWERALLCGLLVVLSPAAATDVFARLAGTWVAQAPAGGAQWLRWTNVVGDLQRLELYPNAEGEPEMLAWLRPSGSTVAEGFLLYDSGAPQAVTAVGNDDVLQINGAADRLSFAIEDDGQLRLTQWKPGETGWKPMRQLQLRPRPTVTGIGGLFFRAGDPGTLARWYTQHLDIAPVPGNYADLPWMQQAGPTVYAPFPAGTDYFGPDRQQWMVNLRVTDLNAMVARLRAAGITVDVDPDSYPNGRFARLRDPEGNPIELWQPAR